MATSSKFSLEEAVRYCTKSSESDLDSCTGGISSGEEEELDLQILDDGLITSYTRFVFNFVAVISYI